MSGAPEGAVPGPSDSPREPRLTCPHTQLLSAQHRCELPPRRREAKPRARPQLSGPRDPHQPWPRAPKCRSQPPAPTVPQGLWDVPQLLLDSQRPELSRAPEGFPVIYHQPLRTKSKINFFPGMDVLSLEGSPPGASPPTPSHPVLPWSQLLSSQGPRPALQHLPSHPPGDLGLWSSPRTRQGWPSRARTLVTGTRPPTRPAVAALFSEAQRPLRFARGPLARQCWTSQDWKPGLWAAWAARASALSAS